MRTRPHWAGELLVLVGLLFVYDLVAGLAKVRPGIAYDHGHHLLSLSPGGLEKAADHWLAGVTWLHAPAAYYYDLAHIDVTVGVLLACWFLRPAVYRRARTALVAVNVVGLVVFLLYPAAPPRLLPDGGFVDVVATSGTWGAWEAGGAVGDHANEFGSLPSLHAAWAVWVALAVAAMTTRRLWRVLAWAHVATTFVVVVVTGNHYLVDVVAGTVVVALAWSLAPALAVRRVPALEAVTD